MSDDYLKAAAQAANQEALMYGVNEEVFLKLARTVREKCAVVAWMHYMDACKAAKISPSGHTAHWNACDKIRGA